MKDMVECTLNITENYLFLSHAKLIPFIPTAFHLGFWLNSFSLTTQIFHYCTYSSLTAHWTKKKITLTTPYFTVEMNELSLGYIHSYHFRTTEILICFLFNFVFLWKFAIRSETPYLLCYNIPLKCIKSLFKDPKIVST